MRLAELGHNVVAVEQNHQIWIVLTATELVIWKPFAWARTNGGRLEIHEAGDIVLHCNF